VLRKESESDNVVSFLHTYLFSIPAEIVMRETFDGFQGGLQIGRRIVTNLHHADDIILLATSEVELRSWCIA